VAVGVLVGDMLSKPTLDFLEDERGVTLLFSNTLAGVTFSGPVALGLGVVPLLLRVVRVLCELLVGVAEGAAASRGVMGVFAVRLLASVGFSGRGVFWLGRSIGILLCVGVCGRCSECGGPSWPCGVQ
jgi:hypothetical protein